MKQNLVKARFPDLCLKAPVGVEGRVLQCEQGDRAGKCLFFANNMGYNAVRGD